MKGLVLAAVAALAGGLLTAVPAQGDHGDPGDHINGHRCRTYDREVSNENTVAALEEVAQIPGVVCEIDAWRIADGTIIVWHDRRWRRVADHSTLPAGIGPDDRPTDATWAQVSQVRTRGGEPVPTLQQMMDAAAENNIRLMVDIRNRLRNEQELVDYGNSVGAEVWWYGLANDACRTRPTDAFLGLGDRVGVKMLRCFLSPQEIESRGFEFTSQSSRGITPEFVADAINRGIEVGTLSGSGSMTEERAEGLVDMGVSRMLLDRPAWALDWFDGPDA